MEKYQAKLNTLSQDIKMIQINGELVLVKDLEKISFEHIQQIGIPKKQINNNSIPQSEYTNFLNTFVQQCPNLSEFSLDFSQWNEFSKEFFMGEITKVYSSLEKNKKFHGLSLIISDNEIQIQDVSTILENLLIMKSNLSHLELDLSYCKCSKIGLQNLKNDFEKVSYLKQLSNLNSLKLILPTHDSESPIISNIYEELSQLKSSQLQNIDLEMNINSDIEIQIVSLLHQFQNLSKLKLKFQQIDPKQFMKLQYYLSKLSKLTSLTLDFNEISLSSLNKGILLNIPLSTELIEFNLFLNNSINGLLGINQIVTMLKQAPKLKKLTLGLQSDGICLEGAKEISKLLTNLENLEYLYLDLNKNHIQTHGAQYLSTALSTLQNLKYLALKLDNNSILSNGIESIGQSFQKLTNLNHLTLSLENNDIEQEAVKALSQSIEKMNHLTYLDINLKNTNIKEKETQQLSKAISNLKNLNTLSLNLNNNQIKSNGLENIVQSMENMYNCLTNLTIQCNSTIFGVECAKYLGKALRQFTCLSHLDLSIPNCYLGNDSYLITQNLSYLTTLKKLSLNISRNNLSVQDFKILSKSIANLTNLSYLDLNVSNNCNEIQAAQYIGELLAELNSLLYLKLDYSDHPVFGNLIENIANGLKNQCNLIELNLNFSNICLTTDNLSKLTVLKYLTELQSLILNFSYMDADSTKEGINEFCDSIKKLKKLVHLDLDFSQSYYWGEQNAQSIGYLLQNLTNLTTLNLNLSGNQITDTDDVQKWNDKNPKNILLLAHSLSKLTKLRQLNLNLNNNLVEADLEIETIGETSYSYTISGEIVFAIAKSLLYMPMLQSLYLNFGLLDLCTKAALGLGETIKVQKNLKYLFLNLEGCELPYFNWGVRSYWTGVWELGAIAISESISCLRNLTSLNLNLANNSISSIGLDRINQQLSQIAGLSTFKFLGHTQTHNDDQENKQQGIKRSFSQLQNLKELYINKNENNISEQNDSEIIELINSAKSLTSLELHTQGTILDDNGKNIFRAISQLKNLNKLNLYQDQINIEQYNLFSIESQITELSLQYNKKNSISESEIRNLIPFFSKFPILQHLKVQFSFYTLFSEGATNIGQGVGQLDNLISLDLNIPSSKLASDAVDLLIGPISLIKSLKKLILNLEKNQLEHTGIQNLCEQLSNMTNLMSLDLNLSANQLCNENIQYLFEKLQGLSQLSKVKLDLCNQNIEYFDFQNLILTSNSIQELQIRYEFTSNTKFKCTMTEENYEKSQLKILDLDVKFEIITPEIYEWLSAQILKNSNLASLNLNTRRNQKNNARQEALYYQSFLKLKKLRFLWLINQNIHYGQNSFYFQQQNSQSIQKKLEEEIQSLQEELK